MHGFQEVDLSGSSRTRMFSSLTRAIQRHSNMRLKQFHIRYTNNQRVFYPSQLLSGQVVLEITKPVKARGVHLTLRGEAYAKWTEPDYQGMRQTQWEDQKTYLNRRITLWGREYGNPTGDNPVLSLGVHTFTFSFQLPANLPSSFESLGRARAYIRYWVAAKVDRPWKLNYKCKRPFAVIEYIDTNTPAFLEPVVRHQHSKSGLLKLEAVIDRAGYFPDESALVSASVRNLTRHQIQLGTITVQLISVTRLFDADPRESRSIRSVGCVLMMAQGCHLPTGATNRWERRRFPISQAPPPVKSCPFIDFSYFIIVSVVVPGRKDLSVQIPVVIGTVPYRVPAPLSVSMVHHGIITNSSLPQTVAMPQLYTEALPPPPSYEEATGSQSINSVNQHELGSLHNTLLHPFAGPEPPPSFYPFAGPEPPSPPYPSPGPGPPPPGSSSQESTATVSTSHVQTVAVEVHLQADRDQPQHPQQSQMSYPEETQPQPQPQHSTYPQQQLFQYEV